MFAVDGPAKEWTIHMDSFKCHAISSIASGSAAALWASLGGPITCMGIMGIRRTCHAQAKARVQRQAQKTHSRFPRTQQQRTCANAQASQSQARSNARWCRQCTIQQTARRHYRQVS